MTPEQIINAFTDTIIKEKDYHEIHPDGRICRGQKGNNAYEQVLDPNGMLPIWTTTYNHKKNTIEIRLNQENAYIRADADDTSKIIKSKNIQAFAEDLEAEGLYVRSLEYALTELCHEEYNQFMIRLKTAQRSDRQLKDNARFRRVFTEKELRHPHISKNHPKLTCYLHNERTFHLSYSQKAAFAFYDTKAYYITESNNIEEFTQICEESHCLNNTLEDALAEKMYLELACPRWGMSW